MSRRRRQNWLTSTVGPLDLTELSQLGTYNHEQPQGVHEETAQKITYEDWRTKKVLSTQNIDGHIFHLPIDYTVVKILGSGAHGVVAEVMIMPASRRLAIKQIRLNLEPSEEDDDKNLNRWRRACWEESLLRQLSEKGGHPNVIMLENVFFASMSNQYEIMFLTNLMETSLDTLMKSRSLTNEEKQRYVYQIFCGLRYLHSNNIIHRDLKPANLLVSGEKLCIADLGQARMIETRRDEISLKVCDDISVDRIMTNLGIGTFIYRAPELHVQCPNYNYSVDQWSAGCTFGEMFLEPNKTFFIGGEQNGNPFAIMEQIFKLIGTPTSPEDIEWLPDHWPVTREDRLSRGAVRSDWSRLSSTNGTAQQLIQKLLEFNPSKRITAEQALQHEYFSDMQVSNLDVVPHPSSSSVIFPVELYQFTTTHELRDFIYNDIKHLKQDN